MDSPSNLQTADARRRAVRAWCLYDWANSAFATTVMAAMYPPFFRSLAMAAGLPPHRATSAWAFTSAVALAVVAAGAPLLGAMADHSGHRKRFLAIMLVCGVLATTAFVANGDDTWLLAAALYLVANVGFAGGNVFYESLLPGLVPAELLDRVSARGYALGYLGGGLLLILNALWVMLPERFGMASAGVAVRASFISVAAWWALFSLPLFRWVPEPASVPTPGAGPWGAAVGRLATTIRGLRHHRQLLLFLVAFWIYNDGVSTIIRMATAYGDEIGIAMPHLVGALVVTQLVGFPCSILFGTLGGAIGAKRAILCGLVVYTAIAVAGFFMSTALHFYLLAAAVGTVQGGTQALSRSLFAAMVPRHKSAELFGFFGASGKLAGIAGPLVFGLVAELSGHSRLSVLSLVGFFVLGAAVLLRVDVADGLRAARSAEADAFESAQLRSRTFST